MGGNDQCGLSGWRAVSMTLGLMDSHTYLDYTTPTSPAAYPHAILPASLYSAHGSCIANIYTDAFGVFFSLPVWFHFLYSVIDGAV